MKKLNLVARSGMLLLGMALAASAALAQTPPSQSVTSAQATSVAQSIQFYRQMHAVLSHPRCVNCHPKDDTPKQGLDGRVHSPPITREPVPLPKAEFDRVVAAWANTGAACPD